MAKARTELIHCDHCGEDYAATYRRCPFCNAKRAKSQGEYADGYEQPDYGEGDYDYEAPHRGGKRLAGGKSAPSGGERHPVKTALYLLSSLVILAAIWIMCSMLIPRLLDRAPAQTAEPTQNAGADVSPSAPAVSDDTQTAAPTPDAAETWAPLPGVVDDPLDLDSPDLPTVEPDPLSSPAASAAPTSTPKPSSEPTPAAGSGLHLSSADFTLNSKDRTYRIRATGAEGSVSFSIKNQAVATVSENGTVTAVGNGWTTLTATDAAGKTATCIVRVNGMDAAQSVDATQAPAQDTPAGSARLSTTDFSISADYPDPVRIRVLDGQAVSWSSKNESVATVSSNGTVTAVGNGSTQILCTLSDGSTLSCSVYVSGK